MQKVINVLAVLSFAGVAGIVGGGTYVYLQRDSIIDGIKAGVTGGAIPGASAGASGSSIPSF